MIEIQPPKLIVLMLVLLLLSCLDRLEDGVCWRSVLLLEEEYHWDRVMKLQSPVSLFCQLSIDPDVKFVATASALCLSAYHHDDH